MRAQKRLLLLACAALWLALPAAAQVMRVYEVRYRTAEDLLPIAETALSGEGRAVADTRTNSIVLSGTRQAVDGAVALLASLDVRTRSVSIRYESRTESLSFPMWPFLAVLIVSFAFMAITMAFQVYRAVQALRGVTVLEEPHETGDATH